MFSPLKCVFSVDLVCKEELNLIMRGDKILTVRGNG